ncbi:MAG: tRNA 2-thiouridine(34) synthase MnmA [Planctomycetes bacterium]|nr:tRNA 2-thiouridine(34) synthase MnmA [Planctomycetota bacterium]
MTAEAGKVIVAMSGGVDSSVAAAMLLRAGYEVTGVFLCLGRADEEGSSGCCSPQDAADARRVAQKLGIAMHVLDAGADFQPIIQYFVDEYRRGRTPNPCIHCNARVKFDRLIRLADSLGVQYVATGHYARRIEGSSGPAIGRAAAMRKDQSYALFAIDRARLGRILLPIGELSGKDEVRRIARKLDLPVHDKPDSQEICFVPDDDYASLLARLAPDALRPGPIVDSAGKALGKHGGYGRFTIGQRHGLRVAAGRPMYVTRIDPASATVTIGPKEEVMSRHLRAASANWHRDVPDEFSSTVQIRYNHSGAAGAVRLTGQGTFEVEFAEPVSAVTPGQAAVVYDGDVMLGGGWIE